MVKYPEKKRHDRHSLTGDGNANQSGEEDANMLRNEKLKLQWSGKWPRCSKVYLVMTRLFRRQPTTLPTSGYLAYVEIQTGRGGCEK